MFLKSFWLLTVIPGSRNRLCGSVKPQSIVQYKDSCSKIAKNPDNFKHKVLLIQKAIHFVAIESLSN